LELGQAVSGSAQVSAQVPEEQSVPAGQLVPQAPQLAGSGVVLAQMGVVPEAVPGQVPLVVQ
jgi:hypothetical protein